MRIYEPSGWVLVHIVNNGEDIYKIFGTWWGGYEHRNHWRLSSGSGSINFYIDETTGKLVSDQYSGSRYILTKDGYQKHNVFGKGFIYELTKSFRNAPDHVQIRLCKLHTVNGEVTWPIEVIEEVSTYEAYFDEE